nr:hypothetical protein Itr_chr15CG09650 [Ipomoea trifida]
MKGDYFGHFECADGLGDTEKKVGWLFDRDVAIVVLGEGDEVFIAGDSRSKTWLTVGCCQLQDMTRP